MNKTIDLHMHTNNSDGTLSPKEVIDEAKKNGVSVISITDHDTIDAYTDELFEYAKSKNIELITGIEVSTKSHGVGIHVLGYNIDIHNNEFRDNLFKLRNIRHKYLHDVGEKLEELGYVLNVEELDKIKSVTKAHIALDIVNNPVNREKLLRDFNKVPNKGEFIETIMNEGCPAYVKKEVVTPSDAAKIIRQAGGKVVLAHPVAYIHQDNLKDNDILEIIKEMNADGIEANYMFYDTERNKFDEVEKWNKIARENNLLATIGSDFHNKEDNHRMIGLINENIHLTDAQIDKIIKSLTSTK